MSTGITHSTLAALALAFALAALTACTSSSPATADGPLLDRGGTERVATEQRAADLTTREAPRPDALLVDGYCEALVEPFCAFYLRCGRMAVTTQVECRTAFLETCNARYERQYAALAAAGLLELSPAGVQACAAHLATVPCDQQPRDLDGPCRGIWIGRQGTGEPCGLDVESFVCDPTSECVLTLSLCGTCRTLLASGASCPSGEATCGTAASCVGGTCQPRGKAGEACDSNTPCVVGAKCASGTCQAPATVKLGEACDADHRCPYLTTCVGGKCQKNARLDESCDAQTRFDGGWCDGGTCRPLLDKGAPCSQAAACLSGRCAGGSCGGLPGPCLAP